MMRDTYDIKELLLFEVVNEGLDFKRVLQYNRFCQRQKWIQWVLTLDNSSAIVVTNITLSQKITCSDVNTNQKTGARDRSKIENPAQKIVASNCHVLVDNLHFS